MLSERYLYMHVHNNVIHNSQKVEASEMSSREWMEKQCVYLYSGILFRLKKEGSSDICYSTEEPWSHDAKRNKQS